MDSSAGDREFNLEEVAERVKDDPNGPSQRTLRVYQVLAASGKFTNWDLICFSAEYLGSHVGILPWLMEPARHLMRLVYIAHYIRFETIAWMDKVTSAGPSEETGPATSGPSESSKSSSEE